MPIFDKYVDDNMVDKQNSRNYYTTNPLNMKSA